MTVPDDIYRGEIPKIWKGEIPEGARRHPAFDVVATKNVGELNIEKAQLSHTYFYSDQLSQHLNELADAHNVVFVVDNQADLWWTTFTWTPRDLVKEAAAQLTVEKIEAHFRSIAFGEGVFNDTYLPREDSPEYKKFAQDLWRLSVDKRVRIVVRQNPITYAYHVTWFPEDVRTVIWPSS